MMKTLRALALISMAFLAIPSFGAISHTGNPTIVGCLDTFATNIPGSSYQWYFGPNAYPKTATTTLPGASTFFLTPGSHTVRVIITTGGGPVGDSLTFTVNASASNITLSSFPTPVCAGVSTTYTASNGYAVYAFFVNDSLIQSASSGAFQATLGAGDSIRVFGSNGGCFSNASNSIIANPNPAAATISSSISNDTICAGDLVVFTATPAGQFGYKFYNNGAEQQSSASNTWSTTQLGQGNQIIVIVRDANGCLSGWSNPIRTFVKPTPRVNITASDTGICQGEPITITGITVQPACAGCPTIYNFIINSVVVQSSTANTYTSTTFNNSDTVVLTGSYDGCAGPATDPLVINVSPAPNVTLSASDDTICQGASVTFTATPSGFTTYTFSNGGTVLQSGPSDTYTTTTITNGMAITVVADNLGCTGPQSNAINMVVVAAPTVDAGTDESACAGSASVTLTGFTPTGGTWSGTGITDPNGTFDPATANTGPNALTYSITDATTGCTGTDTKVFTVNPLPQIVAPSPIDVCNQPAQLSASGGTTYSWSPTTTLDDPNSSTPIATPAQTTSYTVTVTDNNNCSNTASVTVNVNPSPTADFTSTPVCTGMPTTFVNLSSPQTGNKYFWNFGDGTTSTTDNPTHTYNAGGSYTVTLVAELGSCTDTMQQIVTVFPGAVANFDAAPLTSYSDESSPIIFQNQSTNSDNWTWDFGDGNSSTQPSPTHVYGAPGVYTVTLTAANQYGCDDTFTRVNYITIYQNARVFVPNVFSPNGDGANDIFQVFALGTRFVDVDVFNRIGEKVYQSNNVNEGWDGNFKGKLAPPGVYAYSVKVVFDDNTTRYLKGSLTLLR